MVQLAGFPRRQGLYDPSQEKDSCGIGLVAQIQGVRSHRAVEDALQVLCNLDHRGARSADPLTGDGAGILTQLPHRFFAAVAKDLRISLPSPGEYAVGMAFLPRKAEDRQRIQAAIESTITQEGTEFLGWRPVPVKSDEIGSMARKTEPTHWQFFVGRDGITNETAFQHKLYIVRKKIENVVFGMPGGSGSVSGLPGREFFAIPSLSFNTIVYKGMLLPEQVQPYFLDLQESDYETSIALVHSRFSTNTFPAWPLAHPYRYLCHNGEINTLKGNLNWMIARQGRMKSPTLGSDLQKILPIIRSGQSDSACLDNVFEFLLMNGYSLAQAMMVLVPEPWVGNTHMDTALRAFYEYHASLMEPWDGPAALVFTDGKQVGATLDRNGLRPCRYQITSDQYLILSSEAGVLPIESSKIIEKKRLEPGKMFLVDTVEGRIIEDEEIKAKIATQKPYRTWVDNNRISLKDLPEPSAAMLLNGSSQGLAPGLKDLDLLLSQKAFGYSEEELKMVLLPMAISGEESVSSMGNDTPLAILSDRPQLLFKYFKQLFAQVTNPPIDPIREKLVMSLVTYVGPKGDLLQEVPVSCRAIRLEQPILTNQELQKIRQIDDPNFQSTTLRMLFPVAQGAQGLEQALEDLCQQAVEAACGGIQLIILSDRGVDQNWAPIPSLLAMSAVHQRLLSERMRTQVGLIVETAEARDVHHFACLIGYGAASINPYLALDTLSDLVAARRLPEGVEQVDETTAHSKYVQAIGKGLLKIFSKMGISTIQSYFGAQIFEAIGLNKSLVDQWFGGTVSRIGGLDLVNLGEETLRRHQVAYQKNSSVLGSETPLLERGGEIHYRRGGEYHSWNPETISTLQLATRSNDSMTYRQFAKLANEESGHPSTLRGLLELQIEPNPLPLSEVEPAQEIVKRFTTGAMSLGAISREAHETLAIAMNRIGAKSNTGEGGEDAIRYSPLSNGDSANSYIKQIASARFGVTAYYLANAREIQIKMAQGAKPGEGGQLPGHKVDEYIAKLRHSTPGVQLISPPPHHDIYSIEDLAQLIFDLRNSNPEAAISVKLVSEAGVGTVAAGVAKAKANKILISGDTGGTGASPLSSIKNAGLPWELGLAETHQTLVLNHLRDRVRLETDGQLRTGRDVVIAALLGADEFGFATAPLIVQGCIMMRKCHLNTCPVGIATQDPVLREKFAGKPEHVVNYFFMVAEEARELMAQLGFRTMEEMIGRVDKLHAKKLKNLDLTPLLHLKSAEAAPGVIVSEIPLLDTLTEKLVDQCRPAIERGEKLTIESPIRNVDRAVGTLLSSRVMKSRGVEGLPEDTITLRFKGSAGQSFGAFVCTGISLFLEGEANDYVGKGLSGGKIAVFAPKNAAYDPETAVLVGNTILYGATSGQAYLSGVAGERFAVRNSGALAVVEGVGDHGCEYMTGGTVVVLGCTGRNFAAGMSGGIAYVLDEQMGTSKDFLSRCNQTMVEVSKLFDSPDYATENKSENEEDEKLLLQLIRNHFVYTGSAKASRILEQWDQYKHNFFKVLPIEYKKVLESRRLRG